MNIKIVLLAFILLALIWLVWDALKHAVNQTWEEVMLARRSFRRRNGRDPSRGELREELRRAWKR